MKTLSILFAAAFAASALAGPQMSLKPAMRAIPNIPVVKIHGLVGPDGIIRTVDNNTVKSVAVPGPQLLVYDQSRGSGWWGWVDWEPVGYVQSAQPVNTGDPDFPLHYMYNEIPCIAMASCSTMTFAWVVHLPAGGGQTSPALYDMDVNIYDDVSGRSPGDPCSATQAAGCDRPLGAALSTNTWAGLDTGGYGEWVYWEGTLTFDPPLTFYKNFFLGFRFFNVDNVKIDGFLMDLAGKDSQGGIFSERTRWGYGNAVASEGSMQLQVSGAAMQGNAFGEDYVYTNVTTQGCWWWGCDNTINANTRLWFWGTMPFEAGLYGDYGGYGPMYQEPRDSCYIAVSPPYWDVSRRDYAGYNLVRTTIIDPDTLETWLGLPFGDNWPGSTATFDVYFVGQDGYLPEHLHNIDGSGLDVQVDLTSQMANFLFDGVPFMGEFDLRAGDVNLDASVNLIDLGAVLINYNATGVALPLPD